MQIWLILLVVISGLGQPVQVAANSRLREILQSPALSGFLSLSISAALLALLAFCGLMNRGSLLALHHAPWWVWLGGICGALSIVSGILALPSTNAATVIAAAVLGQLVGSMVVDHFGWLNVQPVRISITRILGGVLLFTGALLIARR